ncbi:ATP-binding cassette domain-containing protein [Caballeronia sp. SBC2]|uniref:ATP-binding cassette domain-containing protein n=1 Tax=Caballeronia sp. SBC2 TaxID=2705547 RepID=UPI0013E1BBFB|nr:ATP-binding cassette domain-containing protein [Caballeronia sp. SBC2]QIE25256.1 Leukotoxin export ATP-binding protein LtxB [Caballeronia sp. SBC2]
MNIQTEYPAAALLQAAGIAITGIHGELAQERWRRTCAALAGTSSENALLDQIGREYGLDFLPVRASMQRLDGDVYLARDDNHLWQCVSVRNGVLTDGVSSASQVNAALSGSVKPLYRVVKVQRLGALSFHTFINHWRKEGRLLAQLLWGTFALNLFALVIPLYMNAIYSRVIPAQADASLWVLSFGALLAFGLEYLFRMERAKVMVGLSRSIRSHIEPQVVDQLVRAPLSRTTDWGMATLNGLTGWAKARSLFWSLAASSVLDLLFCVLFFAVIAIVAGWLVFVPLAIWIVECSVVWRFDKYLQKSGLETPSTPFAPLAKPSAYSAGGAFDLLRSMFLSNVERNTSVEERRHVLQARCYAVLMALSSVQTVTTVVAAFYLLQGGHLAAGALFATVILAGRLGQPVFALVSVLPVLRQLRAVFDGINRTNESTAVVEADVARAVPNEQGWRAVDLQFAYLPDQPLLSGINLQILPGEKVAIIGAPASGKSTLAHILLGLMPPEQGQVRYNGQRLTGRRVEALSYQTHYMGQDGMLLGDTLGEYLSAETPETDEACVAALSSVPLQWLPPMLPNGLHTRFDKMPARLTSAQRQMLAMARLSLTQRPIWLLDEPTANLDGPTERAFIELAKNKMTTATTVVLLTDRGNLLSLVNRVIVLTDGAVAFDGSRDAFTTMRAHATAG